MRKVIKSEKVIWIDITKPTEEDVKYLEENFFFHPFILKSVIPHIRHPRFENYGDYLFLVLHYPFFQKDTQQTKPRELDILVTKDTIITIHYNTILPLQSFFTRLTLYEEEQKGFTDEGVGEVLYRLLNEFLKEIFPKLDRIDEKIDDVEKEIFKGRQKEVVREISLRKRDLINFQKVIQPQFAVFEGLKRSSEKFFGKHFYPYFDELFNFFSSIKEILSGLHQTLNELEETNANLLSIRTNEVIKTLTIFTVIVAPLTLIASIFGMNTSYLPFSGNNFDFWIVIGIMAVLVGIMISYIKKKRWI